MDKSNIQRILAAVAQGWATKDEVRQLEEALLNDPSLREQAADWLFDESLLHSEAACLDAAHASDQSLTALVERGNSAKVSACSIAEPAAGQSRVWRTLAAVTAAALACSLLMNVWQARPDTTPNTVVARGDSGARLVQSTGCVWEASADELQPALGGVLKEGAALQLVQGIAEFEIDREGVAATIRLQGPASAIVGSDGTPVLRFGRLVADVRVYGGPCLWDTPLGEIEIGESASIGIEASLGSVALHVFEGSIRVPEILEPESIDDLSPSKEPVAYQAGEAIELKLVGGESIRERVAADRSVFAEERSMATAQLDLPADYSRVIARSNPVGYWRFEEEPAPGGILRNEVKGKVELQLAGSVASVRQGDNHVLEFGMTKDSGWLLSENLWPQAPLESYTMECWFKPSHFHNGALFSLVDQDVSRQRQPCAILVEIGGPYNLYARHTQENAIRFMNRAPATQGAWMAACQADEYSVRTWQHLAAVKEDAEMRLYLDGRVVATARDDRSVPPNLRLVIGQIYTRYPERPFIGQLDEVAIYEHALPASEIRRHCELGSQHTTDEGSI